MTLFTTILQCSHLAAVMKFHTHCIIITTHCNSNSKILSLQNNFSGIQLAICCEFFFTCCHCWLSRISIVAMTHIETRGKNQFPSLMSWLYCTSQGPRWPVWAHSPAPPEGRFSLDHTWCLGLGLHGCMAATQHTCQYGSLVTRTSMNLMVAGFHQSGIQCMKYIHGWKMQSSRKCRTPSSALRSILFLF